MTGVTSGGEMRQAARCLAAHGRCGMQQTVSGRDVNLLRLRQRQFPRNERESNGRVRGVRKLCGFAQRETRRCKQRLYLRLLKGHTTGCSLAVPSVVDRRLPILLPPYPATTRISGTMSRAMLATPQRTATPRIARFTLCNFCISLSLCYLTPLAVVLMAATRGWHTAGTPSTRKNAIMGHQLVNPD